MNTQESSIKLPNQGVMIPQGCFRRRSHGQKEEEIKQKATVLPPFYVVNRSMHHANNKYKLEYLIHNAMSTTNCKRSTENSKTVHCLLFLEHSTLGT